MRTSIPFAIAACSLTLATMAAIPASGVSPALQANGVQGQLVAVATPKGWVVEGPGVQQTLPTKSDIEVTAFVSQGDRWFAAGTTVDEAGRPRMVSFEGSGAGVRSLTSPNVTGAHLALPRLTTTTDGLGVLAWLEGESRETMAVRAAVWGADGWSNAIEVAPAGGSQLALAATGLADGSALLAWSWFDGNDDEVVWSRYNGTRWSPRRRTADDNNVPDITPNVLKRPDGAWLVWSRYDGNDYRVNMAQLTSGAWTPAKVIGGAGSLFPSLIDSNGSALMVYATAVPRTWSVMELGTDGAPGRRASVERTTKERPIVTPRDEDQIDLHWHGLEKSRTSTVRWRSATEE